MTYERLPKNWCFWTVVSETMIEGPLDCKKIKPVNPKGNQPWVFTGRTDAEALLLGPPDEKMWLEKTMITGNDWRKKEKGEAEDEMVIEHRWLNGHESEQTPGDSEGQGSLVCCSSRGRKDSDTT